MFLLVLSCFFKMAKANYPTTITQHPNYKLQNY